MNKEIIEQVRKFVEDECRKPSSNYGFQPYFGHFVPMVAYAKRLAEKLNADLEIVEIAVWLHDIGSIIDGRDNHHITGAEIAMKKLKELDYPEDKIGKVKHCILNHRGSQERDGEIVEAKIVVEADAMSAFDCIEGQFEAALVWEKKSGREARNSVKTKYINKWNQLSTDAKEIIKPKYEAAMLLLND